MPRVNFYDFEKMSAVEIYKLVLTRKIKKFPNGFWKKPEAKKNSKEIVMFLIEDILNWDINKFVSSAIERVLADNKLTGMFQLVYDSTSFKLVDYMFPGKYNPWDLVQAPNGYWNDETAKKALNWLFIEKLKWNLEDVEQNLTLEIFIDNGLQGMLVTLFRGSPYLAAKVIYPELDPNNLTRYPNIKEDGCFSNRKCLVEECDNDAISKGYCRKHYLQIRNHQRLTPELEKSRVRLCVVENCNYQHKGKGYCPKHYDRVKKYGIYIEKNQLSKPLFDIFYDDFDGGCYAVVRANNIIGIHDTLGQAKIDVQEMTLDLLNNKTDWNYY